MSAKAVQISFDEEQLHKIDRDPETKKRGRSAFVRAAIDFFLKEKERRAIDEAIRRAYTPKVADEVEAEFAPFRKVQAWPEEWD
jgi:predicted RNA-binding protein YlxR (DUF448 family)